MSGSVYEDRAKRHLNLEDAIASGCSGLAEVKQRGEMEIGSSTEFDWCDFEEASEFDGNQVNTDAESEMKEALIQVTIPSNDYK